MIGGLTLVPGQPISVNQIGLGAPRVATCCRIVEIWYQGFHAGLVVVTGFSG